MEENQPQEVNENEQKAPYLKIILVAIAVLLVGLVVYFLFQIWPLLVSQNDEQPALTEEPAAETTEHTPPSIEERRRQLDALKEQENPYQLSTEDRREQLDALQTR